ncbi:MAG TPA: hypothetical protein VHO73_04940 [Methylomirabilota bacterium]|nr:hypothetical protein [Methylomirabilota bacterium]
MFGLFLLFLLLGVVFTAPLVRHLQHALPYAAVPTPGRELVHGAQGDYLQFYYYLWLVEERLLAGASFLKDPYQFAIDGPRSNLPNIFLPAALLFVPLSAFGHRFAYNALVLLSFPFAGVAAALLVRRYGVSRTGAVVAGVVFACAPYRVGALLGGHPAGLAYPLVPLVLWGLEGALAGSLGSGLAAGGALLGLALMEPHFAFFAALGLPLYALARIGLPAWRRELLAIGPVAWLAAGAVALAPAYGALGALARQGWGEPLSVRLAVGGVVALLALAVWQGLAACLLAAGVVAEPRAAARGSLAACLPWLLTAAAGTGRVRLVAVALALPLLLHGAGLVVGWRRWWSPRLPLVPVAAAVAGGLAAGGFLLLLQRLLLRRSVSGAGRTLHEVLLFSPTPDDLFTRVNAAAGQTVYPGVVALALAMVAVVALARRQPTGARRLPWIFVPLLAAAMIVSLGPRLEAFPLFEVAFRLVPSWNFIRQPAKAQVLAGLGLAVLAGVGTDALARRGGRVLRGAVALGLGLMVAVEYHPWRPTGVSGLPGSGPEFETVRTEGSRALWVPFWPGDSAYSGLYLYATTLTRVSMLNGYSAWLDRSYLTDVYRPLEVVNLGVVGEAQAQVLRRHGVRQVILDRDAFPLKVSAFGSALALAYLRASPYLDPVDTPPGDWTLQVFRVREAPRAVPATPPPTSPLGILWEAESLGRESGRIADDADASSGRVTLARAPADRPGFVMSGPYRLLPPGDYRARFRLKGVGSTTELQVTSQGGRDVLGRVGIHLADGAFVEVVVPFAVSAPARIEYRARWDGQGWVAMDVVTAAFAAEPDPAPIFEVESLGHELQERPDPHASGGAAGHAIPERTVRDAVWTGPLRRYPAGRYQLWVRLKLDHPVAGTFARCGVELASRGGELAGRDFSGAEVPESGRYVELALPFTLARPAVLEFPCAYRGRVGVWFDRLRVERLEGPA